jgi:aminomuconate-semialdehyde/2-hydroxymuconate-6-semialdehyde dehydrogenase
MPRVLIEAPIYEKFKEAFIKKVSSLKIGDPMREDTDMGPLISFDHRNRVREHIKKAQVEGGRILCGGEEIHFSDNDLSKGFFMQPTVMEGLSISAKINQQEVFGPVVTLIPFSSEEEAVHASNSTSFGLAATLWTQDIKRAHRLAEKIEVGIFWVNTWMLRDLRTPFGGMKSSGVGREGGLEAMRFFTEPKNVCIDYSS